MSNPRSAPTTILFAWRDTCPQWQPLSITDWPRHWMFYYIQIGCVLPQIRRESNPRLHFVCKLHVLPGCPEGWRLLHVIARTVRIYYRWAINKLSECVSWDRDKSLRLSVSVGDRLPGEINYCLVTITLNGNAAHGEMHFDSCNSDLIFVEEKFDIRILSLNTRKKQKCHSFFDGDFNLLWVAKSHLLLLCLLANF